MAGDGEPLHYRVPITGVEEICHVGERFRVTPLIPLLRDGLFYVAAVSQGEMRLFECRRHSIDESDMPDIDLAAAIYRYCSLSETPPSESHRPVRQRPSVERPWEGPLPQWRGSRFGAMASALWALPGSVAPPPLSRRAGPDAAGAAALFRTPDAQLRLGDTRDGRSDAASHQSTARLQHSSGAACH